jgi:hypothetical protein
MGKRVKGVFAIVGAVGIAGILTACASSGTKPDHVNPRDVRLVVSDRAAVKNCTLLTIVRDDDMDDLKEKVAKAGGDTALVTGADGVDVEFVFTF